MLVLFQLCGVFLSGVLQLGGHRCCFIVLICHILPFWTSNWEEYCTGVMRFGLIGITEGQGLIIFLLALTGAIGVDSWNTPLAIPAWVRDNAPALLAPTFAEPMEAKFVVVFLGLIGVLYQSTSSLHSVYKYQREALHSQDTSNAKTFNKAKRMFVHHMLFLCLGCAWVCAPSSVFFQEHPRLILLTIGMLFGYQVVSSLWQRIYIRAHPNNSAHFTSCAALAASIAALHHASFCPLPSVQMGPKVQMIRDSLLLLFCSDVDSFGRCS